jgi:hypothetical protein
MPHWREGEACYATPDLASGEQVTGLVVTADIDALLLTGMARAATSRAPRRMTFAYETQRKAARQARHRLRHIHPYRRAHLKEKPREGLDRDLTGT